MSRFARATDSNHAEIRDGLRKLGVYVFDTSRLGGGFPDLLACIRKEAILLEIKTSTGPPSKRALTKQEQEFFAAYPGPIFKVETLDEALEALGIKKTG